MCLMTLAACTQKTELPENPKDQEEYRDSQGNSWIYNAMLMRWALMVSPSSVNQPSSVKMAPSSSAKSKSSGNVFGTTRRSSGVHA